MVRFCTLLLVFTAFVTGLILFGIGSGPAKTLELEKRIGEGAIASLQTPDQVVAMEGNRSLDETEIKQLQGLLLRDAHYDFTLQKRTPFFSQASFTFEGEEAVTVEWSFAANQVKFTTVHNVVILEFAEPMESLL